MKSQMSKLAGLLFSLFCFCYCHSAYAQPSLFSFEKYISGKGDTLKYRLLYPDSDPLRKYPLVIFLHGAGERGNDNDAQLKWGVMNFASDQNMKWHPAFVIAPQCPLNQSWANTTRGKNNEIILQSTASKPMQLVMEVVADVI